MCGIQTDLLLKFKEEIDIDGAFLVKLKVALHLGND